jgi:hypothetical protein
MRARSQKSASLQKEVGLAKWGLLEVSEKVLGQNRNLSTQKRLKDVKTM